MKRVGLIILTALVTATLVVAGYWWVDSRNNEQTGILQEEPLVALGKNTSTVSSAGFPDFVNAAAAVTPAVVHIKTSYATQGANRSYFDLFGLPQSPVPASGSGSGVLITEDGYIATNNHVVESASGIEVVLPDKRSFQAKLIGTDPSTDLALLKVDAEELPFVTLGNSDSVQVGEWVLAVGYPLSLSSTVTAGIISAKGRSIGILNQPSQDSFSDPDQVTGNTAIESFIQTDAAINRGNSGGALINTNGQLIGINAAIASQTGSYAGYGFAIPVNLMQKVVNDLQKYGEVKRGYLGVSFPAPAAEDQILKERGIDPASVKGVYIMGVQPKSAAAVAGLEEGDIIQSINGARVASSTELSERIARQYPGDKLELTYLRNGRSRRTSVVLKGEEAEQLAESEDAGTARGLQAKLGATFEPVPDQVKQRYGLRSGVYVTEVQRGGFFDMAGIPRGTIITRVNGRRVNNLSDMSKAVEASRRGSVRLDGITPDGASFVISFPLSA
ncbi:trypsin-like peptidase domain-containing protein [Pontibacter anaerobius]|uniref:Trypsin-like peptidase domain-containing protein n=1 Tax=Pontibacter anaerobius TaxID=2993940 RepID=A0ABT3RAV1_9BACT|nr:trypsin-like peptidase domain-containing protein [Pontibacter anaerobius]MCX2738992.1 trypsin-like peptidase domain-containing protein [Pontibacter anaerobius]